MLWYSSGLKEDTKYTIMFDNVFLIQKECMLPRLLCGCT